MEEKNLLLICGNDKLSRRLLSKLPEERHYHLAVDTSTDIGRIFKLLYRKRMDLKTLLNISIAEFSREQYKINHPFDLVKTNKNIEDLITKYQIKTIVLFRVSIIINERLINSGVEIINTHCAKIPEYAGLGAINKALKHGDLDQEATLHHVAKRIDAGKVIAVKPYKLDGKLSYRQNENIAYDAGIDLIIEFMEDKRIEP